MRRVTRCLSVLVIVLAPVAAAAGGISGTVVDADSGGALACNVTLLDTAGEWLDDVWCDVNGAYSLGSVAAGDYLVYASVPEQPEYYGQYYDGAVFLDEATVISVPADQTVAGIDFQLRVGGRVDGTVRAAASGDPLTGIGVVAYSAPDWGVSVFTTSAEDGSYSILGLPPQRYLVQAFDESELYLVQYWDHQALEELATELVFTGDEQVEDVDFDLLLGATISGTVLAAADDSPISGAFVEAHNMDWTHAGYAESDAAGAFTVRGLYPDTYQVYADAADYDDSYYVDSAGVPIPVTLAAGEARTGVVIRLAAGGAISGRLVRSADGSPVVDGYVAAWSLDDAAGDSSGTAADGSFRIGGLLAGTYGLYAEGGELDNLVPQVYADASGDPIPFDVVVGEEISGIEIRLDPGGTISGTVRAAADGQPVVGAEVWADEIEGEGWRGTVSAADGSFELIGIGSGEHLVSARHPDYLQQTYLGALFESNGTPLRVAAGDSLSDVDFALLRSGAISGTMVSAADGAVVADANVEAYFSEEVAVPGAFAQTDATGVYTIGSVPAGTPVYLIAYDWRGRFAWQWYSGALRFADATPVSAAEGGVTEGVDFILETPGAATVSVAGMAFSGQTYQEDIPAQALEIGNDGPGPVDVHLWTDSEWLCLDYDWQAGVLEQGDTLPVSVSVWPWGLAPGSYSDTIHIWDNNSGNALHVAVSLQLGEAAPRFELDPQELYFDAEVDGADPQAQTVYVANYGGGSVSFTATPSVPWLQVSSNAGNLQNGVDATALQVSATVAGLAEGEHVGSLSLSTSAGDDELTVYLVMAPAPEGTPDISAPDSVVVRIPGPPRRGAAGPKVAATFDLGNDGDGTLYWNAREGDDWVDVEPSSGTIPPGADSVSVTVTIDPADLDNGMNSTYLEVGSSRDKAAIELGALVGAEVDLDAVVEPSARGHLVVPVLVHAAGANDSTFVSDLWVSHRPTGLSTAVSLSFVPEGGDGTVQAASTSLTLASGQTVSLLDVMENWLGGAIPKGSLVIQGDDIADIETASRTYNWSAAGTFGQEIPAVLGSDGVARYEGKLYIPGLARSADPATGFRSNLLLTEVSGKSATVNVRLVDEGGAPLGELVRELDPYATTQINRVFDAAGVNTEVSGARAEVEVSAGDGRVVALGSTVDNVTNDPTTTSGIRKDASVATLVVPVVAHGAGVGSTMWVSDVTVSNVDTAGRSVALSYHDRSGAELGSTTLELAAGATEVLDDVVGEVFGISSGRGSLVLDCDPVGGVVVTSRTYNLSAEGTYGQGVPGVDVADALVAGSDVVRLIALTNTHRYRTNIGVTEVLGQPVRVGVTLRDESGGELLGYRELQLAAHGHYQANFFEAVGLGGSNVFAATAVVQVIEGTGGVTVYASTVDNRTGDGTTLPPPRRLDLSPTAPTTGGRGRP